MAVSEAKRASNDRWDRENMAYQTVKVSKTLLEEFRETVAGRGEKVNTVLRQAMEDYINNSGHVATGDGAHVATESCIHAPETCNHAAAPLINDGALALAKESADAAGVTVEEWITGAITSQRERDRLAASLRRGK